MNYTRTRHFFCITFAILIFFTSSYSTNIEIIKNKSRHPITIALVAYDNDAFKSFPIKIMDNNEQYIYTNTPLEIAAGTSLKVSIEIPVALQPFLDKPSFTEIPDIIPAYLQVTTKRFLKKKEKYQNATFNIVYGSHISTLGIWAQKIVANVVTATLTLGNNAPTVNLCIDENGSPMMSLVD